MFAPTYGDTWPTFNGAIGMTYEQGGSGTGARPTPAPTATRSHSASALPTTTLPAGPPFRLPPSATIDLLREFQAYFTNARTKPGGLYKTYVLASGNDPGQLGKLTQYLERQQYPLWLRAQAAANHAATATPAGKTGGRRPCSPTTCW
ncbi:MAG: hypothetical protein WKG07_17660 [Hymenobacter sp.]